MKELAVLKLFTEKRKMFEQYNSYMRKMDNLDRAISILLRTIQKYYDQYPEHSYIGSDELWAFYEAQNPNSKERQMHLELINKMYDLDVSTDMMETLLEQIMERYHASQILSKLLPVIEGHKFGVLPNIQADVDNFVTEMKNPPKSKMALEPCTLSASELVYGRLDFVGAPWPIETLNAIIGNAQPQTLGVVFAFVDGGKTSFMLSSCASFCKYFNGTDQMVVYAANEEPKKRLSERAVSAFTGLSFPEIKAKYPKDEDGGNEELDQLLIEESRGYLRILDGVHHLSIVKKILEEWRPAVLMVDQGSKVKTDLNLKEIQAVRELYGTYRRYAEEYNCAIVCVEQAISDGEFKQWLTLSDIYGSRVAIQGELDWALGIGKVEEKSNKRFFNVCKNKLKDGEKSKFVVRFDEDRCRWR